MQRLHCWLDQFSFRRGRNREVDSGRRIVSQNIASSYNVGLNARSKHEFRRVPMSTITTSVSTMPRKPDTGSFVRRRGIRTNPWLYVSDSLLRNSAYHHSETPQSYSCRSIDRKYAPPTQLGVTSLEESTCSSGYGSQDSSPDSSIHIPSWQTAHFNRDEPVDGVSLFEETSSFSTYDNVCDADDEHIYHELEMCCRASDQTCNSAVLPTLADSRLSSPLYARPESPIYAQPWAHRQSECEHRYPNVQLAKQRSFPSQALTVRNQLFHYMKPEIPYNEYAKPFDIETSTGDCLRETTSLVDREPCFPSACCEIFAKRHMSRNSALEKADEEFLSELDAQIAELQMRSDELRSIVEKACQRRHAANWLRPSMNCTFELSI